MPLKHLICSATAISHLLTYINKPILFKELREIFMTDETKKILRDQKVKPVHLRIHSDIFCVFLVS